MDHHRTEQLSRQAIRALAGIILLALAGIILLSLWGAALRYGLLGADKASAEGAADEALSILGNVASAAVGGLVGWLTRDIIVRETSPEQQPEQDDDT